MNNMKRALVANEIILPDNRDNGHGDILALELVLWPETVLFHLLLSTLLESGHLRVSYFTRVNRPVVNSSTVRALLSMWQH